jgi:hypothetical protein
VYFVQLSVSLCVSLRRFRILLSYGNKVCLRSY